MRKRIYIISFIFLAGFAACKTARQKEDNKIYETVDEIPQYPGGDVARQKFIAENLVYPPIAIETGKEGTLYVRFVVEKDGSSSNHEVFKKFDDDCAAEAVRVVKLMKWQPGKLNGKPVRVQITMPIKFKLN